jgi:8-oxo-dGTP pyrophosphatase MutT (NUDIX family)
MAATDWLDREPIRRLLPAVRALHDGESPSLNRDELEGLIPPNKVFRPAGVLVGLVPRDRGWQLLLTRRTERLANHAGQISFPGGRIEPTDADAVAAAIRETEEETGIDGRHIVPFGLLDRYATISAFDVTPVMAVVDPTAAIAHDPHEVDEVFEVPLAHVLDRRNVHREERLFMGRMRGYFVIPYQHYRIWGATAGMLVNLIERLERHGIEPADFG